MSNESKASGEELKCEDCGKKSKDVKEGFCPYAEEIHGEQTPATLCPDCYYGRVLET